MKVWAKTTLICTGVLLAGAVIIFLIFTTEPVATRTTATKETAMLVETAPVEFGTFRPMIVAVGTVVPSRDIMLRPRVSGLIIDIADNFTPGGIVNEGDMLVQIDPADYRNTLKQRQSDLHQSRADLAIEMGRQNVAEQEFQLFEEDVTDDYRSLVLREPQLEAARAQVEFDQAQVNQAQLELDRTTVKAPFDAQILTRQVNVGSQVMAGDVLARMVGLNTYWVETEVPLAKFRWLSLPQDGDQPGTEVQLRHVTAWPKGVYRTGRLYKVIGELNQQTRYVRVLVTVDDPLSYLSENSDLPKLIAGLFVEVRMEADPIRDVVRLNRDYLRSNDTVWVMTDDDTLDIRDVEVVFLDPQYAYIRGGLSADDTVVASNLATVVQGASLRLKKSQTGMENSRPRDESLAGGNQQ